MINKTLYRASSLVIGKLGQMVIKSGNLLNKVSVRLNQLSEPHLYASLRNVLSAWYKDKGDQTLRLDYELDEASVVFDLGGYEGQWTSDIFAKYCCLIHVFEPMKESAKNIEERFSKNRKIIVHQFGLASETTFTAISPNKDASSIYTLGDEREEIQLIKAADFIEQNQIAFIDLMKINIEGAEYDLLDHLIDSGLVKHITNIQVQFHNFVPNAEIRMLDIQKKLKDTHNLTYQYRFVWENWTKK